MFDGRPVHPATASEPPRFSKVILHLLTGMGFPFVSLTFFPIRSLKFRTSAPAYQNKPYLFIVPYCRRTECENDMSPAMPWVALKVISTSEKSLPCGNISWGIKTRFIKESVWVVHAQGPGCSVTERYQPDVFILIIIYFSMVPLCLSLCLVRVCVKAPCKDFLLTGALRSVLLHKKCKKRKEKKLLNVCIIG